MGATGLGNLLVKEGLLTEQDRLTIAKTCGQSSWAFAKCVLSMGMLDEDELAAFFAERTKYHVAPRDLLDEIDPDILAKIDGRMVARLEVLPIKADWEQVQVAVCDPLDKGALRQLEFFTGLEVAPLIAPLSVIYEGLARLIPGFKPHDPALANFLQNHAATSWQRQRIEEEGLLSSHAQGIQEDSLDDLDDDELESDVDELYDADGTSDIEDDLEDLGDDISTEDFEDHDASSPSNSRDTADSGGDDEWDDFDDVDQNSASGEGASEKAEDFDSFENDLDDLSFDEHSAADKTADKSDGPSIDDLDFDADADDSDSSHAEARPNAETSEDIDDFFVEGLDEPKPSEAKAASSAESLSQSSPSEQDDTGFDLGLDDLSESEDLGDEDQESKDAISALDAEPTLKTMESQRLSDVDSSRTDHPNENDELFDDLEDDDPSLAETVEPTRIDNSLPSTDKDELTSADADDDDDLIDDLFEKSEIPISQDDDEDLIAAQDNDSSMSRDDRRSEPMASDELIDDIPIRPSTENVPQAPSNAAPNILRSAARKAPSRPVSELNQAMLRLSLASSVEKALEIAQSTLSQISDCGFIAEASDHGFHLQTAWNRGAHSNEEPAWFATALEQCRDQTAGQWTTVFLADDLVAGSSQPARAFAYIIPATAERICVVIADPDRSDPIEANVFESAKKFLDLLAKRL